MTSAFTVSNAGADTAAVIPTITAPAGWTVLMGTAPFRVAPHGTETWLVSFSAPANAAARKYMIRAALASGGVTISDSVSVRVGERRAIELLPMDVPGWVIAGSRYEARFIVRNRGNVSSTINFAGSTSRGTRCITEPAAATLAPGATASVTVRIAIAAALPRSTDDVLQLTATDAHDAQVSTLASARTTIVPREGASDLATIPSMLSVRSIGGASGVSPIALAGAGVLPDEKTTIDFNLQAPAGRQSPFGFGERDEYRVNLKSDRYSVRLGDNLYGFSPLTMSGSAGIGGEAQGVNGDIAAGVYAQRLRWLPGSNSEEGVFVGTAPDSARQLTTTFVERQDAAGAVSVGSVGGHVRLPGGATLQAEVAMSDSAKATGTAQRARLTGTFDRLTYDFGILRGAGDFAGPARGTSSDEGTISARLTNDLTLSASGSVRVSSVALLLSGIPAQRLSTATISANYAGRATLEYGWLSRRDDGVVSALDGTQHGLRATGSLPIGVVNLTASVEHGTVDALAGPSPRDYTVVSLSAQANLGKVGDFSIYGAHDDGATLTGASGGVANAGVNLRLRLPFSLELNVSTAAQRATLGVFDGSGAWFSQTDARLDYRFANGSALALRERVWQNPFLQGSADARAVYLEYRTPLRLPVGASRHPGRAEGRIVDSETGKPVAGALVRISDQAAVTDKDGRVTFTGLPAEQFRVSLDATGAAAGALLLGDPVVDMREPSARPTMFSLAVARGATIRAVVRRLAPASTLAENADSMVAVGVQSNVLVALESGRDTIYQSSDDKGQIDFGSVAPGAWTLTVLPGDLPDHHVFEDDRMVVTVRPGEHREVELRLVPQRRTVTFVGQDATLKARQLPERD